MLSIIESSNAAIRSNGGGPSRNSSIGVAGSGVEQRVPPKPLSAVSFASLNSILLYGLGEHYRYMDEKRRYSPGWSRNVASISPQTMRYRWVNPDALAGWSTSLMAATLQGLAAFATGPPESRTMLFLFAFVELLCALIGTQDYIFIVPRPPHAIFADFLAAHLTNERRIARITTHVWVFVTAHGAAVKST